MVRDPVGRDARGIPRDSVAVARAAALRLELGVVVGGDPDEHPDGRPGQSLGGLAAVLERLPGDLQEQPLLRVDEDRLAGGDAEEVGVELVDCLEESAAPRECPRPLKASRSQREAGIGPTASTPSRSSLQNASGPSRPGTGSRCR